MSGSGIEMAKLALMLFIKSLPEKCIFEVISFGDRFEHMSKSKLGFSYNDHNVKSVLDKIDEFKADFGGTDILNPMSEALTKYKSTIEKRIFLLTDGQA
jgi:uncharacterized protein with von Willebrand factor type A (vWA) domain